MKREKAERSRAGTKKSQSSRKNNPQELARAEQRVFNVDFLVEPHRCELCNREISRTVMILCAKCGIILCLQCLAKGAEKDNHKKTDDYFVLDALKHPIYSPDWTAKEELMLVKGLEKFGVDNWAEIADYIGSKTSNECEVHYYSFYYKSATDKSPSVSDIVVERDKTGKITVNRKKAQAALAKAAGYMVEKDARDKEEEKELRPEELKKATKKVKSHAKVPEKMKDQVKPAPEVVGYMPLRGDFNIEYDNDAELLLADMEFFEDDTQSEQDLKYEILKLYNAKLDERIRRKKFVIEKGLLDVKKQQQLERKRPKEEREIYNQMKPYMRFCEDHEFQQLVEGLIEEKALRQRLEELKMFKSLGLETFDQVDKYLEKKHLENLELTGIKAGSSPLSAARNNKTTRVPRAKEGVNQIVKAPKYEELNDREKELCIALTVQPSVYLDLKKKLVTKAFKQKISRSVVVDLIDKEMTKDKAFVIYDFLVYHGTLSSKARKSD